VRALVRLHPKALQFFLRALQVDAELIFQRPLASALLGVAFLLLALACLARFFLPLVPLGQPTFLLVAA
jgi:hypothetical protein